MSVAGWGIFIIVIAIALIARLTQESQAPRRGHTLLPPDVNSAHSAFRSKRSIFFVEVVVFDFDWDGPTLYINGKFQNSESRWHIDMVTANVDMGGDNDLFESFDPDGEAIYGASRLTSLVNFSAPAILEPYEKGLFRSPLANHERKERLDGYLTSLNEAAKASVAAFDQEYESYSLDDVGLAQLVDRFMNERSVSAIARLIADELFWRAGQVKIRAAYLSNAGDLDANYSDFIAVDEVEATFLLTGESAALLRQNVDTMIVNALRRAFELPILPYHTVTLEA